MSKHVLIVGASGVIGLAAVASFENAGWTVTTLSRAAKGSGHGQHIAADLLDMEALDAAAPALRGVTHLFYTALRPDADPAREADLNAAMVENVVAALRRADAPLERVTIIQGGKIYGAHLGVYKTPAREEDSRHFPPNLYFRHEDFVIALAKEGIRWTALRPDIVIGHSIGSPMTLGNLIGVYGSLCRETGTAMQFPGPDAAYRDVLVNITAAEVVGEAALWAAETNADGAYNITNGDVFRWSHVWPVLGAWFDLPIGEPQPISLDQRMKAIAPVWTELATREGLAEVDIGLIAQGGFGDFIFNVKTDAVFDLTKARRAGFGGMIRRSEEVLIAHLERMCDLRLIPSPRGK